MRRAGSLAFSLIGSDGVEFRGTGPNGSIVCSWSSIPNNSKRRRCTFDFTLTSRLEFTDLVTPTSFPRPPQGATGILVFPYTAAALGVPGGSATPSPAWDNAPANFFNDFGDCAGGKTSDCYRWERFAATLYAGTTSEVHTVGFDVDKSAQSVSVYIVVAADLRDNPRQTLTIGPEADNCGIVRDFNDFRTNVNTPVIQVGYFEGFGSSRGFCSFSLAALPADAEILSATLEMVSSETVGVDENTIVDHLVYGTLNDDDFDLAALTAGIGSFPPDDNISLDVHDALTADLGADRQRSQFRLRRAVESGLDQGEVSYVGPSGDTPPSLEIVYRKR